MHYAQINHGNRLTKVMNLFWFVSRLVDQHEHKTPSWYHSLIKDLIGFWDLATMSQPLDKIMSKPGWSVSLIYKCKLEPLLDLH